LKEGAGDRDEEDNNTNVVEEFRGE